VAFVACFAFIPPGRAQFRATHWDADAGLPQNIVRGIVQMPDGYLWIATLNGVARFDGVRFTTFDRSNTRGITTNRFAAIAEGANGDLWLDAENGALTQYHHGKFHTLDASEGISQSSVHGITSDRAGNVWILSNGKILKWDNPANKFKSIDDSGALSYNSLVWVGTGFWAVQGKVLTCFVHGGFLHYELPPNVPPPDIHNVAVGADGAVWLALPNARMARFLSNKWLLASNSVEMPFVDPTRSSWKAMITSRLERILELPSGGVPRGISYNTIVEDNEHDVWVGAEGQGLYRIERQTIHTYSEAEGLAGAKVYPVLAAKNGDVWIGTWPAGLTQFHQGAIRTYTPRDGVPGLITALAESHNDDLWIGTHNGLAVLSHGQIQPEPNLPKAFPVIQAIFETQNGTLLLGTPVGVYRYDPVSRQGSWFQPQPGVSLGDVRVIIRGNNGDLWLGGYSGLTRIQNGELTQWTEQNGLPSNSVRAIYEDPQGVIWVGTYDGGLGRLDNGRWTHYTEASGLFDNGVFQILEDSHANLWMSSNRGVFRISKKQLNDYAGGKDSTLISVSYGRNDGMLNTECNGGLWPAGAIDKQGRLWFPTQDGVAVVDPDLVPVSQRSPKIVIESVLIDHNPSDLEKPVTVDTGQESLEIEYTALSFYRPDQIVFRYKMDGLDSKWQNVGYRRTAYFSHMPSGKYTFRLMAANSDGVWSETRGIPVTVLPPFYLNPWFLVATLLVLGSLLYALWSYRVSQLRKIQAAQQAFSQELIYSQESERRRISAELHDSLGQRLILIKNHALFLLRPSAQKLSDEERKQTIEDISDEAAYAIEETRTISYNLRPFQLDRLGLAKAIEALVRSASRATQIKFTTQLDEIDDSFPEDLRINFYRIVQEAVNNIIKHSAATEADIAVKKNENRILLSIRDNGNGLALEQKIAPPVGKGGFGLTGIKERAAVLGGTVRMQSSPGFGTLLSCDFDPTKLKRS
jgi:signal transduction histidine kinase/ligand-binding sensor domain-containing protein